jgi:hypothetical protein
MSCEVMKLELIGLEGCYDESSNDAQQMTNDYLRSSAVSILMAFTTCIALSIA